MKPDLLTRLAPYLPYDVVIDYTAVNGTSFKETLDAELYYDFSLEKNRDWYLNFKPYFRSFSHLTSTILHNGVEVIPAHEIAKLALSVRDASLKGTHYNGVWLTVSTDAGEVEIHTEYDILTYVSDEFAPTCNQVAIVDLLRSMHFALPPFQTEDYIEKVL